MSNPPARAEAAAPVSWLLRLYVAGMTPVDRRALYNLEALCDAHLAGRYTLEVVDLLDHPDLAEQNQIIAVPTLVRDQPGPARKIIGDLSNTSRVLQGLGLPSVPAVTSS